MPISESPGSPGQTKTCNQQAHGTLHKPNHAELLCSAEALIAMSLQQIAQEIAQNEKLHVEFLRKALGSSAVPCPQVNLTAFSAVFDAAVAPAKFSPAFSPFNSDLAFLLATFLFEDVGVSAYQGKLPLLTRPDLMSVKPWESGVNLELPK